MALLVAGAAGARAQTPAAPPELTPLGKRLLQADVKRQESVNLQESVKREKNYALPYQTCAFPGGLCGLVDRNGKVLLAPQFDWVDHFYEERALVRLRGRYGFVDTSGRIVAEPRYELASRFKGNYAQVVLDDKMGLIDREGKFVFEPAYGYIAPFGKETFKASTGRKLCWNLVDIVIDGQLVAFDECADKPSTIGAQQRRRGDIMVAHMPAEIMGPSPAIFPDGMIDILDRKGQRLNRVDLLVLGELGSFDLNAVARTETGWGVIRADGTWVVEPNVEAIGNTTGEMAPAKRNGKWGYIDKDGRWIISERFNYAGPFVKGRSFAAAAVGERYGLIDRSGSWVIEPRFLHLRHSGLLGHWKNRWVVETDHAHGLVDEATLRPLLLDAKLDYLPKMCGDGRILGRVKQAGRLFTSEGKPLHPLEGELWPPIDCRTPHLVKAGAKYGLVDASMQWLARPDFDAIGAFSFDLAPAKWGGKAGVLRQDGTWAMEPQFDDISVADKDIYRARLGGKVGLVRLDGSWVVEARYDAIQLVPGGGRALVKRDDVAGMVDLASGRWMIGPLRGEICLASFWGGPIITEADGRRAVYDEHSGVEYIPPHYERIGLGFSDGLVPVLKAGKWGFADLTGKLVIPLTWDEPAFFSQGVAWVKTDARWCPIDRRGERIRHLACRDSDPQGLGSSRHICRITH
jgi:hypothetical protein